MEVDISILSIDLRAVDSKRLYSRIEPTCLQSSPSFVVSFLTSIYFQDFGIYEVSEIEIMQNVSVYIQKSDTM